MKFINLLISFKFSNVKGSIIVPTTLETNVIELHKFLYGDEAYTPSATVKANSEKILEIVGGESSLDDKQATVEEGWAEVISDFKEAAKKLPAKYSDLTGPDKNDLGRATKGAAMAFLGKAYLMKPTPDFTLAAEQFKAVMDLNIYNLTTWIAIKSLKNHVTAFMSPYTIPYNYFRWFFFR